jgi:hypothetical protein
MDTIYTAVLFPLLLLIGQTLVAVGQRRLNMRMDEGEAKRNQAKADTDAKRAAEAKWRDAVTTHMQRQDEHMALMTSSLQSTMRATLIHNAEKYFSRGSITPEEQASWCDMHDRYSAMGFNGLIDSYRAKIDLLPHVTIDELAQGEQMD